jgi:hypothetical protein
MKLAEFRKEMEAYRRFVDEEARLFKDSYLALDRLHAMYQKFDSAERTMAHEVIAEWALSDDEALRFDALALIDDFKIANEIPVLQKLASRLASSSAPGAPYELKKVNRILKDLRVGGLKWPRASNLDSKL